MPVISDPFAGFGPPGRIKFLVLGSPDEYSGELMFPARSLKNLEHVSPAGMRQEISRRRSPKTADETVLAPMRRWFFARKPDAGFVLMDFPATLLQAKVFDEWLEARGESLHGVVAGEQSSPDIVQHYRTLGLLWEPPRSAVP